MPRPSWMLSKGKPKASLEVRAGSKASPSAASLRSNIADGAESQLGSAWEVSQPKVDSCKSIWDRAYEDLRKDEKKLVEDFERLLASEHEIHPSAGLDKGNPSERDKKMSALVERKLEAMNKTQWRFTVGDKSVKVREQVDRVVKVVLVAKRFVSSVGNIDPLHVGLPLAGVCLLLSLVVNDSRQCKAAIDGLEYISKLIRRYAEIEQLYLEGEASLTGEYLEAAVTKLYSQILEYEARAACQFDRNTAFQVARNIVEADGWESILGNIKESETACDKLTRIIDARDQQVRIKRLDAALDKQSREVDKLLNDSRVQDEEYAKLQLTELRAVKDEQKDWHRNEEESRCYESLRTTDYEFLKDKNPDRVLGTCEWFLQHPRYRKWLDELSSSWLWVTADPGCGKSVLSKFLIDEYKKSSSTWTEKSNTCYFFFKDDSGETRSATHALCALLHQLFSQNKTLLKHAIPEYHQNRDKLPQLFETLWRIFRTAVEDPDAGGVICVLDALDECAESTRYPLIRKLAEFYSNPKPTAKLKFIVTSRPNIPIGDAFFRHGQDPASVQLMGENESEMEAISVEISLVIKERVNQFKTLRGRRGVHDDVHVVLQEQLNQIENRTYLWVSLIFPELEKNSGLAKGKLVRIVQEIPDTVDEAYERILTRSVDIDEAKKLLHIVVAATRPLTLAEMNVALSIKDGDNSEDDLDLDPEQSFRTRVRELCGHLVSIKDSKIYLIHQTAKDFLVFRESFGDSQSSTRVLGHWKYSLRPEKSNFVFAKLCVSYLLFGVFESHPLGIMPKDFDYRGGKEYIAPYLSKHTFLAYAAEHWTTHFRTAEPKDATLLESAMKIINFHSNLCMTWLPIYFYAVGNIYQHPSNFSDLMIGSYFGLEAIVKLLLDRGDNTEMTDFTFRQTPLAWAALNGHEAVVRLLLDRGAETECKAASGGTPLFFAVRYGHEAVITLLLDRGAEIECKAAGGETPLFWAVRYGHEAVITLLLDRGAEIECKAAGGETPLFFAARYRHEAVITLLLDRGAEIECKAAGGETPLFWAVRYGHEAVITLLLDRGAEIECKAAGGETPLFWAVRYEHEAVIRLLLDRGAEIECKDEHCRTSLLLAARLGRHELVRLLISRGADVHAQSNCGENSLHAAAIRGQEEIMRLLLTKEADIKRKDRWGRTALHWAVWYGVGTAVQLLLTEGAMVDDVDSSGETPLHCAAGYEQNREVRMLLEKEALPFKAANREGFMALHATWPKGRKEIVQLLLEMGADIEATDNHGQTPLWMATLSEKVSIVELLLEHKADVSATKNDRSTILHGAARGGNSKIVELLLNHGADIEAVDCAKQTALDVAVQRRQGAVIRLLLNHKADLNASTVVKSTALHVAAESRT